jgi:Zn-dependent protease/CBS domain-containing protein
MKNSLGVGRILGVPIFLHYTLIIIMLLFAAVFGFTSGSILGFTLGYGNLPLAWPWLLLLGAIAAILFFLSVLVHELAHSYYAIRKGYTISGITLFIFGGVSQIEHTPEGAPGEGTMAFVGPLSSIVIGAIFTPVYLILGNMSGGVALQATTITVGIIAFYNLFLGAFNLIPAFPMDGGRVLRAYLVKRLGFLRATEVAANVGKVLAVAMAIFGIFYSIFLIFIAVFIFLAAGEEQRATRFNEALKGLKAADLMTRSVATASIDDTVSNIMSRMMAEKHTGYPVVNSTALVGMVSIEDAARIPEKDRPSTPVSRIMSTRIVTVTTETKATDVLEKMSTTGISRILVTENGLLVGIITGSDLAKVVDMVLRAQKASSGQQSTMGLTKP